MNIQQLIEKVGGEIVLGRAQVRQGTKYTVIGRATPDGMVMTAEGKALADSLKDTKPKPKRSGKKADNQTG